MVAPKGVELISTSDDETKLLPLMVSVSPCCSCVTVSVLGESEPISGAGRELPHKGFSVLLQPRTEKASASRQANDTPQLRRRMGDTPLRMVLPVRLIEQKHPVRGRNLVPSAGSLNTNAKRPPNVGWSHSF